MISTSIAENLVHARKVGVLARLLRQVRGQWRRVKCHPPVQQQREEAQHGQPHDRYTRVHALVAPRARAAAEEAAGARQASGLAPAPSRWPPQRAAGRRRCSAPSQTSRRFWHIACLYRPCTYRAGAVSLSARKHTSRTAALAQRRRVPGSAQDEHNSELIFHDSGSSPPRSRPRCLRKRGELARTVSRRRTVDPQLTTGTWRICGHKLTGDCLYVSMRIV